MRKLSPSVVVSVLAAAAVAAALLTTVTRAQEAPAAQPAPAQPTRLCVVWSSGDPDVAHRVCLMYAHAAKQAKWFDEVRLVVWGPSARLLAADKDLQAKVKAMGKDGVDLKACVVCADSYGVTPALRAMGLEVKPMGEPLSDMLKGGWTVITF